MRLILVLLCIFLLGGSVSAASPQENIDRASVIVVGRVESAGIESTVRVLHVLKGRVNEQNVVVEYFLPEGEEVFLLLDDGLRVGENSVGLIRDGQVYAIDNFEYRGYEESDYVEGYNEYWEKRLKELQGSMPFYLYVALGVATGYAVLKYVNERKR